MAQWASRAPDTRASYEHTRTLSQSSLRLLALPPPAAVVILGALRQVWQMEEVMTRWQYLVFDVSTCPSEMLDSVLDRHGRDGWELCAVITTTGHFVFKRPWEPDLNIRPEDVGMPE